MNDAQLIKGLGGPAKVAELLGYEKLGGIQRVHNWTQRGIPARVRLERPDLFAEAPKVAAPPAVQAATQGDGGHAG